MATSFSIQQFRDAVGSGSRPNLFLVRVTPPAGISLDGFEFLCRSASLPASSMGLIEVPMTGGRRLKMAGDRTFTEWSTTVLNDENFTIRSNIEVWQNSMVYTNYTTTQIGDDGGRSGAIAGPGLMDGVADIFQLGPDGSSVPYGSYKLINCWPSDIASIDLSYDTTDTVEDFTITWSYDYFVINDAAV